MPNTYDIVLMGATSFVGKITARRFASAGADDDLSVKVALAGRSADKLRELADGINRDYPGVEFDTLVADSMNPAQMSDLAASARVVISTVGPYDLYGEQLVAACVKHGTHYCDLTGEPQFVHRMIERYEQDAKASGACIVHCCGFDSIPSDLGVYYLQQQSVEKFGEPCVDVNMRVKALSGGFSGGTIASLIHIVQLVKSKPEMKKVLFNPYALCPETYKAKQHYIGKAQSDWATDNWIGPFVMAAINSKVVMRSSQLIPSYPAESFSYNEAMQTGRGSKGRRRARFITAAMAVITVGSAFSLTRWALQRMLPKPGEGPSEQAQQDGFYIINHYGETATGKQLAVQVKGDEDPGYGSTSKMLMQAGLALACDLPEGTQGGFWTPASLLGESLLSRLTEHAGLTIETLPQPK